MDIKTELLSGEELFAGITAEVPPLPFEVRLHALIDEAVGVVKTDMSDATGGHLTHYELRDLGRKRFIGLCYGRWRVLDNLEKESRKRKYSSD